MHGLDTLKRLNGETRSQEEILAESSKTLGQIDAEKSGGADDALLVAREITRALLFLCVRGDVEKDGCLREAHDILCSVRDKLLA